MSRWPRVLVTAALLLFAGVGMAQTRAWLDRDRIAAGETTTLNVETDAGDPPDYAPLAQDFDLSGQASQQQVDWVNGRMRIRSLYAVALRPRRDGLLQVPALRVGGRSTAPLTLLVTPGATAATAARGDIFIESEADDQDPYVQQSVGWVVRLYSAIPLIAGRLDQAEPDGASLQRVGDDVQFRRTVGDRNYVVTERRFLLIPERSGELVMPPARFDGRGTGNVFDRLFGDGEEALHAVGRPRVLRIRPIPADAPQPWLPLRALTLRYLEMPQRAKAGTASSVLVELTADGASAAQLPELSLPATSSAQVFADRPQSDESMVDGRPRVRLQRRFSIVPTTAGRLELPGPAIEWWDTQAGRARVTRLPSITLQVAPGAVSPDAAQSPSEVPSSGDAPGATTSRELPWGLLAALAGVLLLAGGLVHFARGPRGTAAANGPRPMDSAGAASDVPAVFSTEARVMQAPPPDLPRLLQLGDLAGIDQALRRLAGARGADLDAVADALDDDSQRRAVIALRDARWGGGDAADALARLRSAFARGPRWRAEKATEAGPLPPLYPRA